MGVCFFVSDLHGKLPRYEKLFSHVSLEKPSAVFFGGDLLPSEYSLIRGEDSKDNFIFQVLRTGLAALKEELGEQYPQIFIILGNDDPRVAEHELLKGQEEGLWQYIHDRKVMFGGYSVYGYACVPPTPFLAKDWERYDVSRFVDVGSISPEDGWRSQPVDINKIRYGTIKEDLENLIGTDDLSNAIMLFHAPPYQTNLDRAALDGVMVDHCLLDVHVGSIAIKRLIVNCQPLYTLHGHIHESASITGSWWEKIGRTTLFSAACDSEHLALVRFDPDDPLSGSRELI